MKGDLIKKLFFEFPEFEFLYEKDDSIGSVYDVFGDFGIFFSEIIMEWKEKGNRYKTFDLSNIDDKEKMAKEIFSFINQNIDFNSELRDLIKISILEPLHDYDFLLATSREFLQGNALSELNAIKV